MTFVGEGSVGRQVARHGRQKAVMEALNNAGRPHPIVVVSNLCVDEGDILMRVRRGLHHGLLTVTHLSNRDAVL